MKELSRIRPKLSDVAQMARVGNATVSRVLNGGKNVSEETARRIEGAILTLGYKPNRAARSLKGASSGIIGMIVPSISDMFFSGCAEAVEQVVRENGGMLIVTASHDSPRAVLESFQQLMLHHIDGLILVPSSLQEQGLLEELKHASIPVVGIDRPLLKGRFASVVCENFEGAREGTEHLLGHGYTDVLLLQVHPKLYTMRERMRGYSAAMAAAGRVCRGVEIHDVASARVALQKALDEAQRSIGVLAGNNLAARFALEAVLSLNLRMPADLGMLSFDDFDLADALSPPMSVVQQPVRELGREAARLLFQQLHAEAPVEREGTPSLVMLPTRLVLRGSCGFHPQTP